MTGLDTNILLRYLLLDDPVQSPKAVRVIEREARRSNVLFVSLTTILEIVWVLQSYYEMSDQETAGAVQKILQIERFTVQNKNEVSAAARALYSGDGSFADVLIGALGVWAGCKSTLTFDRKAARLPGFELIS